VSGGGLRPPTLVRFSTVAATVGWPEITRAIERMVEVEGLTRKDVAPTAGAERLSRVDEPFHTDAFLLVFPAIALLSGCDP